MGKKRKGSKSQEKAWNEQTSGTGVAQRTGNRFLQKRSLAPSGEAGTAGWFFDGQGGT